MKIIKSYSKNIYAIIFIMVLASFVTAPFVYSDDGERYKDDSLSVFSPGYLNAAKYQAEAVMKQQTQQNKGLLQNLIDYAQNKTANKIETADNEKTQNKPLLQQKMSSPKGKSNASAVTSTVVNAISAAGTTSISPYITNVVREYLNVVGDGGVPYNIKAANGKYYLLWTGSDAISTYEKFQVFNQDGTTVLNAPSTMATVNLPDGQNTNRMVSANWDYSLQNCVSGVGDITTLANGDILLSWTEQYGWDRSTKVQTFNADGNALTTPFTITSDNTKKAEVYNVTPLENGDIAVFWVEYDLSSVDGYDNYYTLKTQRFDTNGDAISSTLTTLVGGISSTDCESVENGAILANGNIVVFWNQTDSEGNSSIKSQIFDVNGNAVLSTPTTLSDNGGWIDNVTTLSNGNIAVFWEGRGSENNSYVKAQVLDSNGKAMLSTPTTLSDVGGYVNNVVTLENGNIAVLFYGGADNSLETQILDPNGNTLLASPITLSQHYASGVNIITLSNGNIAVFWSENWESEKAQIFDMNGNLITSTSTAMLGDNVNNLDNVTILSNGNIAVFWTAADGGIDVQVFNPNGKAVSSVVVMGGDDSGMTFFENVTALDNGNIAVFWGEQTPDFHQSLSMQILGANGNTLFAAPVMLTTDEASNGARIDKIATFANGNIAVFWSEGVNGMAGSTKLQIFNMNGNAILAAPITIDDGISIGGGSFTNLANGDMVIFWNNSTSSFETSVLDAYGNFHSADILQPPARIVSLTEMGNSIYANASINPLNVDIAYNDPTSYTAQARSLATAASGDVSGAFRALLMDKNLSLSQDITPAGGYVDASGKAEADLLKESAISASLEMFSAQDIEAAMRLASIMKNPTEDQKFIISAIKALLLDTSKFAEDPSGKANAELKKAEKDLLNMVANVLLAQAMPDLLNKGDMANIKSIFSNLNNVKGKIMLQYEQAIKPYYENVLRDIAKNMSTLQTQNVLSANMSKEELDKLPPSELDKILEKMKKQEKKTFEEEYILQQEAKYRSTYLDPNKRKLEEDMKGLMKDFTSQIGDVLRTGQK